METPGFYQTGYCNAQFTLEKRFSDGKSGDNFIVEELLNDPNEGVAADVGLDAGMTGSSTDSSATTAFDASCNTSFSTAEPHFQAAHVGGPRCFTDGHFSSELCVPYDDLAELEWLSNFVEESFSCEDMQRLQLVQGMKSRTEEASQTHLHQFQHEPARPGPTFRPEMSVPAKARSKRSRAAPGNWTSHLQVAQPALASNVPAISSSQPEIATGKKSVRPAPAQKKKEVPDNSAGGEGRKCLHCATDKTPQWRTGPTGPKTLCNACGVRYKSGRLVPEYRPASSPTFVLTKHSNSHRKVLELRRQKELMRAQQHQHQHQQYLQHHQNMMFDSSNGDDYLIPQHIGPDFSQLI